MATIGFSQDSSKWRTPPPDLYKLCEPESEIFLQQQTTEQNMSDQKTEIEAAAFRRLLQHLDERKDVQNIDLMIQAGFCRNCLSKWYLAAAEERDISMNLDDAREVVYGMTYSEWKDNHQAEATPEQLASPGTRPISIRVTR